MKWNDEEIRFDSAITLTVKPCPWIFHNSLQFISLLILVNGGEVNKTFCSVFSVPSQQRNHGRHSCPWGRRANRKSILLIQWKFFSLKADGHWNLVQTGLTKRLHIMTQREKNSVMPYDRYFLFCYPLLHQRKLCIWLGVYTQSCMRAWSKTVPRSFYCISLICSANFCCLPEPTSYLSKSTWVQRQHNVITPHVLSLTSPLRPAIKLTLY